MSELLAELVSDGFARLSMYGWFLISAHQWGKRFALDWESTRPAWSRPSSRGNAIKGARPAAHKGER